MIFDHIGVVVKSLSQGRRFFMEPLGFGEWTEEIADEALKVRVQFGRQHNGVVVELIEPLGEDSPVYSSIQRGTNILNHFAYRVPSLVLAEAQLREKGCVPIGRAAGAKAYRLAAVQFFYTPQKFIVELIESSVDVLKFLEFGE